MNHMVTGERGEKNPVWKSVAVWPTQKQFQTGSFKSISEKKIFWNKNLIKNLFS